MPNQLNFPELITTVSYQRPSRIDNVDLEYIQDSESQVIFGTTRNDTVEVWAYNPDGSIVGGVTIGVDDPALELNTIVDTSGTREVLNVDFKSIAYRMGLSPGRYAVVLNFFRNEIGSKDGYKLYVSDVSTDRTEVKLRLVDEVDGSKKDIWEFITPSVSRRYVKGLIDQVFGSLVSGDNQDDDVFSHLMGKLNGEIGLSSKLIYSNSNNSFSQLFKDVMGRSHKKVIDKIAENGNDYYYQYDELVSLVSESISEAIREKTLEGSVDPRFVIE